MKRFRKNLAFFVFDGYNNAMFRFVSNGINVAHKLTKASDPVKEFGRHVHNFYEILYIVKGNVTYNVESEKRKLNSGELVIISPGRYHFAEVCEDAPYERYTLKFPEEIVPAHVLKKLTGKGTFFDFKKEYASFFSNLDSYASTYSEEDAETLFCCDIVRLLIILCNEDSCSSEQNDIIGRIVEYIDQNIYSPLSLDSISREFSFSKSYISNKFKKTMKIPIMQYVRYKKIIRAQQLIAGGEKKSYVCKKLGFDNYSTFYRNYVRAMGDEASLLLDQPETNS